jgi:hypothetical protein
MLGTGTCIGMKQPAFHSVKAQKVRAADGTPTSLEATNLIVTVSLSMLQQPQRLDSTMILLNPQLDQ